MNVLELFAGAGGGILGGRLLGWRTVCAVENNEYARSVLIARQNDGCLEPFPIWDDVQTFDGRPWRGFVDVVSGGFPCQDISQAGKGAGIQGKKSGLWMEMARIVCEVECRYVFMENSANLNRRGLEIVLGDLAEMGFDARWGVLGANAAPISAPHQRARTWLVASHPHRSAMESDKRGDLHNKERDPAFAQTRWQNKPVEPIRAPWLPASGELDRALDGVAGGMDKDRRRTLGNGQIPAVAALAWRILNEE